MVNPEIYYGLGNVAYALVKADNQLHRVESLETRMLLLEQPHGELAMQSFQANECYKLSVEDAYSNAFGRFRTHKNQFTKSLRKQFLKIIRALAQADNCVSAKEFEFIKKFRNDLKTV